MKPGHLWACVGLMMVTGVLLQVRGGQDYVPETVPMTRFPESIGRWTGEQIPLDTAVLQVLGKGVFLNRSYVAKASVATLAEGDEVNSAPVNLFIGYFPSQRTGQSIHSPQNCLPGSGWVFESSGVTLLKDRQGKVSEVGDYLVSDGTDEQEVLYWYQSHGRTIANDYRAKLDMMLDSIRYHRTDAALIRLTTVVRHTESRAQAHQRLVDLAQQVAPLLSTYIAD